MVSDMAVGEGVEITGDKLPMKIKARPLLLNCNSKWLYQCDYLSQ